MIGWSPGVTSDAGSVRDFPPGTSAFVAQLACLAHVGHAQPRRVVDEAWRVRLLVKGSHVSDVQLKVLGCVLGRRARGVPPAGAQVELVLLDCRAGLFRVLRRGRNLQSVRHEFHAGIESVVCV